MNVLIYSGADTSPTSLANTFASIRSLLVPNYAVQTVSTQALSAHPWSKTCALLVFPQLIPPGSITSGAPLSPSASKEIQNYVAQGGAVLSLGTAVRVGPPRARSVLPLFEQLSGLSLSNPSSPGAATSTSTKVIFEDEASGIKIALDPASARSDVDKNDVQLTDGTRIEGLAHVEPIDLTALRDSQKARIAVLARDASAGISAESAHAVAIKTCIGRGTITFWSAQLETPPPLHGARLAALRITLSDLGLSIPKQGPTSNIPARPTPQLLVAVPWREGVVESILHALEIPAPDEQCAEYELKDSNDTFLFHTHAADKAAQIFANARAAALLSGEDPTSWNPKHVVVYPSKELPPGDLTPKFDVAAFFDALKAERKERGYTERYAEGQWGAGEALLYGEIVTSTQTMLDKNTRLLTGFPVPLLSLASAQLTGRGRGANVWLSPPGCLQFSLLLRAPLSSFPGTKIVFVQYLAAIAIAEACRSEGVLGPAGEQVWIKWPNDLYAVTSDGERRKIGGILVNTSFGSGKVELVVGCGVNVLNPPPILSLAQLLPAGGAQSPPTMERTLAAIMARFDRMWAQFVAARGSFEPFMDLYLERWLHSDQLVTLTSVTPPRRVRIVGITPEHGLLRTMAEPEAGAVWTGGGGPEYIDLQPDGNSFDLMAGLIKTKS